MARIVPTGMFMECIYVTVCSIAIQATGIVSNAAQRRKAAAAALDAYLTIKIMSKPHASEK